MSLTLDATLLPAFAIDLESQLLEHLSAITELARSGLGEQLQAVVLGGSLARGQGVVVSEAEGRERIASDIDFYLVTGHPHDAASRKVQEEIRRAHARSPFSELSLDLGVVGPRWIAKLRPTLPAHQLVHGHKILWAAEPGYTVVVDSVDPERDDQVDKDDALKLMMNRFAEHLLLVSRLHSTPPDPAALYHRWKLYLDVPLAWLALRARYRPFRGEQRETLTAMWDGLGRPRPGWWKGGIELMRVTHETMRSEAVSVDTLQGLRPNLDWDALDVHLEEQGEVRRGRIPELNWTWPFFRDGLRHCLGLSHEDPAVGLQRAVEEGAPGPADLVLVLKWLRRRPFLQRMREARRWAPLGPEGVSPWYRHARGGSGEERVQTACALRFGGLNTWTFVLRELLSSQSMAEGSSLRGQELDLWLGGQWSDWIMRGERE